MRTIAIFAIALIGVLIYAVSMRTYSTNPMVFFLGALAAGLIGYLLAEHFFTLRLKAVKAE